LFERFTDPARQVVVHAQDEARAFRHDFIGTEHLLLGLLREEEGIAARVLASLGVTVEEVRVDVASIVGEGSEMATGQIPFTPRVKKVFDFAMREAVALSHDHIGPEHILLVIVRENEGVAARILHDLDAHAEAIRREIIRRLSGTAGADVWNWAPGSPPFAPQVAEVLEALRRKKAEALGAQDFERAAWARDRERRLIQQARRFDAVWRGEAPDGGEPSASVPAGRTSRMPRRVADYERPAREMLIPVAAGWLLFGLASALGLLVGWLIWG
jgi:ATP-dependent Clp protease ATP-binding subunit ClpA